MFWDREIINKMADNMDTEEKKEEQENTEEIASPSELRFTVNMTSKVLYDFLLYHAYTKVSGILSVCFGAAGVIFYFRFGEIMYLALGVLLILYLPVNLWYRSKVQMMNPVFKKPITYDISADGISVFQDGESGKVSWDQCTKAVSTKQSIIVYTGKLNASIFPRKELGDDLSALMALIGKYMEPKRVKIRF